MLTPDSNTGADRTSTHLTAQKTLCPSCRSGNTEAFFRQDDVPVFCNVAFDSEAKARSAPKASIELRLCHECGFIYNASFDPHDMEYEVEYENALHFSPTFRQYAQQLARQLIERFDLRGKRIVEIGCGDGYFLSLLCDQGSNTGFGFDPSYHQDQHVPHSPHVTFRQEYFDPGKLDSPADLICCRHVLEHIGQPQEFLSRLHQAVRHRPGARLFFEVPAARSIFSGESIWDILYEHCGYYVSESMKRLFVRSGFEPLATWRSYHNQFLCMFARPVSEMKSTLSLGQPVSPELAQWTKDFSKTFDQRVANAHKCLQSFQRQNKKIVFWGAGSKGVNVLNSIPDSHRLVQYIVDVNPRKQGRFIPGSAQRIVSPEFLHDYAPQVVILLNPNYRDEVTRMLAELHVSATVLLA